MHKKHFIQVVVQPNEAMSGDQNWAHLIIIEIVDGVQ